MSPDPSRLEEVWLRVQAVPPADRARTLADACGSDHALRRRVAELLDAARTAELERLFDNEPEALLAATDVPLTFGRYELRGLIGAGGMGEVYDGWDTTLNRPVALKTLPVRRGSQVAEGRFRREVAALARLEHPNVVTLFDAELDADRPFLVMERLRGKTLGELVRQGGPRPADEAVRLVTAAAFGLATVHAAGLTHRDVKPDNLFLTDDGVVKVLDLGVSGFTTAEADSHLTTDGLAVGTAEYVAPEQLDGETGPHRVPPGAVRGGVCAADRGGVRGADAGAPGEAVEAAGEGAGLRADEGGAAGGGSGARADVSGSAGR